MRSKNTFVVAGNRPGKHAARLRDFVEDADGWLYAVSAYDNAERIGCILRYIPDPQGERVNTLGKRFRKIDFEEAYELVATCKPHYTDLIHRIPPADIVRMIKPEEEIHKIITRDQRVKKLVDLFSLPRGSIGCTGSLLCGLEQPGSDIDLVVYGKAWFQAQALLRSCIEEGRVKDLPEELWHTIYMKRRPEISFEQFMRHEIRKWNRGEIEGTYFDLLYTRSYSDLPVVSTGRGRVTGKMRIEAKVTDASLSFDNPAVYVVEHDRITRVLAFTHTYSGQALAGEIIEACGVCEEHQGETWLIVGTTREARGEYIISKTLLES
jgi:predicted nucleotidyltransferase